MKTEIKTTNVQSQGKDSKCSPLSSLYCNLKINVTGKLKDNDLNKLYNCSLCNSCHLATFNKGTREKAVTKSLITHHVAEIRKNIMESGNSYGIKTVKSKSSQKTIETLLFRGCTPTHKTPEILAASESLLKRKGIKYEIMDDETCCGNLLFNLGDTGSGQDAVRRNIDKFNAAGVKRIITICPGCYNAFNKYYRTQNGFKPEIILAVDLLDSLTMESEDLMIQDPCHAREKAGTLRKILPGSQNKSASPCCGAGAGVMAHNKLVATKKARKTIENRSERIVTYCPFCYLNMSSVTPDKIVDIYMLLNDCLVDSPIHY
ncbi:MAG: (Fe-S)-binding protein [Methanobacteriaceae archaeon]|jgi:Fe-S oxidoreductase|nr:(Fe-S)-binding protein [Methanobacteriaceae archaeon]